MRKTLGLAFGALMLSATVAGATPITFSCGASAGTCNGLTYAVTLDAHSGNSYTYSYYINTDPNTYGGSLTDYVHAVAIQGGGLGTVSSPTLVAAPGPEANWNIFASGLNNGTGGCGGGNTNAVCSEYIGAGYPLFTPSGQGQILQWTFSFTSDSANPASTVDIKYLFTDGTKDNQGDYTKIGSLGSWDIGVQDCTAGCTGGGGGGGGNAPEPATMALFGLALTFGAARLRKRTK